jgi:hypothetical protein
MNDDGNENKPSPAPETNGNTHHNNAPARRWHKVMQSPNKLGRPKSPKTIAEVRELAREKTGAMIEFLSKTALNAKAPYNARVTAAIEVLNRGWGRPHQSMDLNHGVQDGLAEFLEQIDGRHKIRTIEGTTVGPALEVKQSLLDHEQGGQQGPVQAQLGPGESSE